MKASLSPFEGLEIIELHAEICSWIWPECRLHIDHLDSTRDDIFIRIVRSGAIRTLLYGSHALVALLVQQTTVGLRLG